MPILKANQSHALKSNSVIITKQCLLIGSAQQSRLFSLTFTRSILADVCSSSRRISITKWPASSHLRHPTIFTTINTTTPTRKTRTKPHALAIFSRPETSLITASIAITTDNRKISARKDLMSPARHPVKLSTGLIYVDWGGAAMSTVAQRCSSKRN